MRMFTIIWSDKVRDKKQLKDLGIERRIIGGGIDNTGSGQNPMTTL
jgi:hypothetical protein